VNVERCSISEVLLITPTVHGDERGFFLESYNQRDFANAGISGNFVQDNQSRSARGVLRGLHFQLNHPQGKLVRVVRGAVFDVAADVRVGSPTFGQWVGATLDENNKKALWVPPGFAHGFCVLSDSADVLYKATDFYAPSDEKGIIWNDAALAIEWPIDSPILSAKDRRFGPLDKSREDLPRY
jgi:dTDP-4-dehydrorhamnose 3,5-epimerase